MSLAYQQLLRGVALRLNALVGSQVATLAASYDTATLTATQFKSADFPFNSFRDAIIMSVGEFAWAIADTANHPWRGVLPQTVSSNIANGGAVPTTGIGIPDYIIDSTDFTQLTEQPLEVVQRIVRETWRLYGTYFYKILGKKVYHTRPLVNIAVLTFDRTTEVTAFNAAGNCVLPDVLEAAITARSLSNMLKNTELEDKAAVYRIYSDEALAAIRAGSTTVNPMPAPIPRATAA